MSTARNEAPARGCPECGTELDAYHHQWTESVSQLEHTEERCAAARLLCAEPPPETPTENP